MNICVRISTSANDYTNLNTTVHRSSVISSASITSFRRVRGSSSPLYPGPQRRTRARSFPEVVQVVEDENYLISTCS